MKSSHPSYDELEAYSVAGAGARDRDGDERAVAQHVAGCEECSELVKKLRTLDSELQALKQLPSQNSEACPGIESWLQLAGGLIQEQSALRLLEHAAHCRSCARALEDAKSYLTTDPVPPESFKSSTEAWQRNVARLISLHSPGPAREPSRFSWQWALAGSFALIVVAIAVVLLTVSRSSPLARTDTLIAQAYFGNRTVEMRFPQAQHSPMNQRRGDSESSRFSGLDSSPSFRRAVDRVGDELRHRPEDPAWLVRRARIDLLDWRYKPALSTLDQIPATAMDNYEVLGTRAIAEFERGEIEKRSEDFARAEEDLTRALKIHPNDPGLLFNRALVYEKLMMYESARDDWRQVLSHEADAGWRNEAERHLAALEEKKTPTSSK